MNLQNFVVPELTLPLIGILGLLSIWQYYRNQILAGRIHAVDFWDLSGIRMFLHASAQDERTCASCQDAHGTVFLPSAAIRKNFSPLRHPCSSSVGCRCLVVGLYGGWPEADAIVRRLRNDTKAKPQHLTEEEFKDLLNGPWEKSVRGAADRLTLHMLEAIQMEAMDLEGAIIRYRYVVDQAKGARDLRLLVPAFIRLAEVLERSGDHEEVLTVIDRFEKRFPTQRSSFYFPTSHQRKAMATRKIRLQSVLKQKMRSSEKKADMGSEQQEVPVSS